MSALDQVSRTSYTEMRVAFCQQKGVSSACNNAALLQTYAEMLNPSRSKRTESQPKGLDKRAYRALLLEKRGKLGKKKPAPRSG